MRFSMNTKLRRRLGDAKAVQLLNAINQARDVLVDPVRRAELDSSLVEKKTVAPSATATQRAAQRAASAPSQEERTRNAPPARKQQPSTSQVARKRGHQLERHGPGVRVPMRYVAQPALEEHGFRICPISF